MAEATLGTRKALALLDVRREGMDYCLVLDGLTVRFSQNEVNTLLTMFQEAIAEAP